MAKHIVKCYYCGEKFDRDTVPCKKVTGNRYAHADCTEANQKEKTQEELDKEKLDNYIIKLFNLEYVNARIRKQIKDFMEQYNYTYDSILKSLVYWYDVKGNSIAKANNAIGIVPYIHDQACQYYYNLSLIRLSNANKDFSKYQPKVKRIKICSPAREQKKLKLFDLGED